MVNDALSGMMASPPDPAPQQRAASDIFEQVFGLSPHTATNVTDQPLDLSGTGAALENQMQVPQQANGPQINTQTTQAPQDYTSLEKGLIDQNAGIRASNASVPPVTMTNGQPRPGSAALVTALSILLNSIDRKNAPGGQLANSFLQNTANQANVDFQNKTAERNQTIAQGNAKLQSNQELANFYANESAKQDAAKKQQTQIDANLALQRMKDQGKLSVAEVGQLMKMAPEARANYAKNWLGITDQGTLDSLATLTPKEKKDVAGANLSDARVNKTNADTEAIYLKNVRGLPLGQARSDYLQGTPLADKYTPEQLDAMGLANPKELQELGQSAYLKARTADLNATSPEKVKLLKSRAEMIGKQVSAFDSLTAAKIAGTYAKIDDIRSQIGNRNFTQDMAVQNLGLNNLKAINSSLSSQGHDIKSQIVTMQHAAGELAKKMVDPATSDDDKKKLGQQLKDLNDRIGIAATQFKSYTDDAQKLRTQLGMQADGSFKVPKSNIAPNGVMTTDGIQQLAAKAQTALTDGQHDPNKVRIMFKQTTGLDLDKVLKT